MQMMELFWLLLPIAAASGWLAAKASSKRKESGSTDPSPAYFRGLNYLLNEQPDKAIDVFVKMLEVDSDTVETHLALGNLFRRRGEVDRAIRIHQNLIARPTLNRDQRAQALLELGQDYMRAGLFDRAESLFKELGDMDMYKEQALNNLRIIYQQEKEWGKCLEVARSLEQLNGRPLSTERAHYYCELAEEALARKDHKEAAALLKKAQGSDPVCVRATIIQAGMEEADGAFKTAIRTFALIEKQDPAYIVEILPSLIECHRQLGSRRELVSYLHQLYERQPGIAPALALAGFIQEDEGVAVAIRFITDYLNHHPNLEGLRWLIRHSLKDCGEKEGPILQILQQQVDKLLEHHPVYHCSRCGFSAKTLHWQCPGCKAWGSIKPNQGLSEGRH